VDGPEVDDDEENEGHLAKDAVTKAALMEQLEQPAAEKAREAAEKAKEAEVFTCRLSHREYGGKKNYGVCSAYRTQGLRHNCEHGRRKDACRDCGTGHCEHGRRRGRCKDCGTGHCEHGHRRGAVQRLLDAAAVFSKMST
jgi:hypothetical protein